ncbi:hypothetical protein DERF_005432 [Dermatophagoides farinae]|uniref:Uncharacterized protein n=1 Tax=Dermatophagoides farinae TaxID=6954 RepID=A0A922I6W4_DERFA|nr:hypothetical protein DERF_005432 [Dermatophagoides farinae]
MKTNEILGLSIILYIYKLLFESNTFNVLFCERKGIVESNVEDEMRWSINSIEIEFIEMRQPWRSKKVISRILKMK